MIEWETSDLGTDYDWSFLYGKFRSEAEIVELELQANRDALKVLAECSCRTPGQRCTHLAKAIDATCISKASSEAEAIYEVFKYDIHGTNIN